MTILVNVPAIDVGPFLNGSPADKLAVAAQVRDACEQIGFFTITGHGIPADVFHTFRNEALAFFARPEQERMAVVQPASKISRGYSGQATRALAFSMGETTPPDLQQSYAMGPVDPAPANAVGTPAEQAFFYPNYWPDGQPALRPAFEAYYRQANALAQQVLRMFAVALGLDEYFFDDKVSRHTSTMRALLYPGQPVAPAEGQLRAGAHTDYGTLTIVRGDDVPGGLQVKLRHGDWVDVHPSPDAFVCNIGDLMMRWTNDRWLSNVHRVANPPPEFSHVPRFSSAFFHNPNFDAEIACIDRGASSKYDTVAFGDYYLGKHLRAQNMNKAAA